MTATNGYKKYTTAIDSKLFINHVFSKDYKELIIPRCIPVVYNWEELSPYNATIGYAENVYIDYHNERIYFDILIDTNLPLTKYLMEKVIKGCGGCRPIVCTTADNKSGVYSIVAISISDEYDKCYFGINEDYI